MTEKLTADERRLLEADAQTSQPSATEQPDITAVDHGETTPEGKPKGRARKGAVANDPVATPEKTATSTDPADPADPADSQDSKAEKESAAVRGTLTPAQVEGDGWGQTPVQARG